MAQQKQQKVLRMFKYSFYLGFVAFIVHFALKLYMGYSALDFKYSPIYYVAWRDLEDADLGTGCFIPMKKKIDTPGGKEVDRYLNLVQPNEPKMNNSLYQDFRPDVFLYGKVDQYKLFKNDDEISLEKVFLEARRDFMSVMIPPESYKIVGKEEPIQRTEYMVVDEDIKFENAKQFNSVEKQAIVQWLDDSKDTNPWINQFNKLIGDIYSHPDNYKISFENNEISFSEDFEAAINEIITSYNKSAEIGKSGLDMDNIKDWIQTIAFCKPKGRGLHALSRVYYLFFYLHSAVTREDFKTKSMQKKLSEIDEIRKSDSSDNDKEAKIKRVTKGMNSLRTTYINQAFTYLVAGLFKGDESVEFPYDSAKDPRGFFAKVYSIPSLSINKEKLETIEKVIEAMSFLCCGDSTKHVLYLIGSFRHKKEFLKATFGIDMVDKSYAEYPATFNSDKLVFRVCSEEMVSESIRAMQIELSSAIIYLSSEDKDVSFDKPTLFILMNGQTTQKADDLFIPVSANGDFHDSKAALKKLIDMMRE